MKRLTLILCTLLASQLMWAGIHTYTEESVLQSGNVIKLRVSKTGVHAIPYDSLKAWGLRAENVCVLGYGGGMLSENFTEHHWDDLPPVSFYMHKGSDKVFNSGDYILFYAQGPTRWDCQSNGVWRHTQNTYSNYGYYFVTDNVALQRELTVRAACAETNVRDVDWYTAYRVHEKDEVNLIDPSGLSGGGREFYGEKFTQNGNSLSLSFALQNVRTDIPTRCYVDVAASAGEEVSMRLDYAGNTASIKIPAISVSDFYTKAQTQSIELEANATSTGSQSMVLSFKGKSSSSVGYLNYVEVNAPCSLIMTGNEMAIANTSLLGRDSQTRFNLKGASPHTQIWRVTDGVNIEQMPTTYSDNTLSWVGSDATAEKYLAVNPSVNFTKPTRVGKVAHQNLHGLSNIDYVIICPKDFYEPAVRLARKHEEVDNLTWAVVTDEQVYNEFSSGTPDATAYRWLMKMLYDRSGGNNSLTRPKNLLLMGKGVYDNRKILSNSGVRKLLTYQAENSTNETAAYATDDYFGILSDKSGVYQGVFSILRAQMNIGVGRLPVKTLEEANQMVDKLCTYMDDKSLGKWKTQLLFLADDGDHGLHVQTADGGAERLRRKNKDFVINKIYLDAYTQEVSAAGESYPLAKNRFDNLMSTGVLFMDYSGHGGYNNITNELFMRITDIRRMNNANQGFWFLATCSFSHCDGGVTSAGEEAVLNPIGGAIGVLSACRTVYATQNTVLNRNLCDTLFGHKTAFDYNMTLGEVTRVAKNQTGTDENKMAYILLGDPAIRLNYPTDYQVKTVSELDTIHALSVQTIEGFIMSSDGDTASWFNGILDITVLDKMQEITTRDNDEVNEEEKVKLKYMDYPNTLFVGQTDVKDGLFSFTFMVPKDIRYNYGNGRIVYYAHDPESGEEAVGHFEDFVIGGSSSVIAKDTIGPALYIYLNTPHFRNGDKTYEFPHFYADIYDENGINTAGTGIGHDLLMVIDSEPTKTYVLNDYFQANNNSYQEGRVSYKMIEQSEGAHTLTFRAWDLHNNSSTASLNFYVVKGMDPEINSVITYPNPVSSTGVLNIKIEHNQPNETIHSLVNLYNLNGQLVYQMKQEGSETIQWNLSDVNLGAGIYVYQVNIKTPTSNYVSKAGKLIIN